MIYLKFNFLLKNFLIVLWLSLEKYKIQAGAELGQAQHKLGLDFTLILCSFGFSRFGMVELIRWFQLAGFIEQVWFGIFGFYILDLLLNRFDNVRKFWRYSLVYLVQQIWFGLVPNEIICFNILSFGFGKFGQLNLFN